MSEITNRRRRANCGVAGLDKPPLINPDNMRAAAAFTKCFDRLMPHIHLEASDFSSWGAAGLAIEAGALSMTVRSSRPSLIPPHKQNLGAPVCAVGSPEYS